MTTATVLVESEGFTPLTLSAVRQALEGLDLPDDTPIRLLFDSGYGVRACEVVATGVAPDGRTTIYFEGQ